MWRQRCGVCSLLHLNSKQASEQASMQGSMSFDCVQLYVSKTKRKTAAAMELAPELQRLLTHDHLAASLHAVHLRDTCFKRMHRILRHYRRRYSTLVAFVPSGSTGVF